MQNLGGEFPVRHLGEFRVERQDVEHVNTERFEGPGLLVWLHQLEGRLGGAEVDPRVRIEGDDTELAVELARRFCGQRDHLLVAAVDSVEAAHRYGCAAVTFRQTLPTLDDSKTPHEPLRGTMIRASPSTTVLPFTRQAVSNVAWALAVSSVLTVTRAVTASPIFTGRRNRRDCDR